VNITGSGRYCVSIAWTTDSKASAQVSDTRQGQHVRLCLRGLDELRTLIKEDLRKFKKKSNGLIKNEWLAGYCLNQLRYHTPLKGTEKTSWKNATHIKSAKITCK
jgi:hypothetical protein